MKISDTFQSLISSYIDWNVVLGDPCYNYITKHIVAWNSYKHEIFEPPIRRSIVASLIKNRQYSFKIFDDDSIIQLFYQYAPDNEALIEAHLSYYNSGFTVTELEEKNIFKNEESVTIFEVPISYSPEFPVDLSNDPLVPWIRIDYDPEEHNGPLHHACHMHISLLDNCRIPLSQVPSPRQFIEFVMAFFYPEQYRITRLDDNWQPKDFVKMCSFNEDCFQLINDEVYEILPHICIPRRA